jgi:hypothetical protein
MNYIVLTLLTNVNRFTLHVCAFFSLTRRKMKKILIFLWDEDAVMRDAGEKILNS